MSKFVYFCFWIVSTNGCFQYFHCRHRGIQSEKDNLVIGDFLPQNPICSISLIVEWFKKNVSHPFISGFTDFGTNANYLRTYGISEKGEGILNTKSISLFQNIYHTHLIKRYGEYMALIYCRNLNFIFNLNLRVGKLILSEQYDSFGKRITYSSFNPQTKELIFVFRGSDNLIDYLIDARIRLIPANQTETSIPVTSTSQVHSGFWGRFANTRNMVTIDLFNSIAQIRSMDSSAVADFHIVVVGHSLGASWAFIPTADWIASGIPIAAFYSYGMPIVGNKEFVDILSNIIGPNRIVRVVNGLDGIPHLGVLNAEHPSSVPEIFFDKGMSEPKICHYQMEGSPFCSNKYNCHQWDHAAHSEVGNLSIRSDICNITSLISSNVYF